MMQVKMTIEEYQNDIKACHNDGSDAYQNTSEAC